MTVWKVLKFLRLTSSAMKLSASILSLFLFMSCSVTTDKSSLKSVLLEQLKNTHTTKGWFVPLNIAIEGLTAEQANWSDSTENHSIGELVTHLNFWNERNLIAFQDKPQAEFKGNNKETFTKLDYTGWKKAVSKSDSIQTLIEHFVEQATEAQLEKWSSTIGNISTHNAYHTGQIIYIRKQHGWWDNSKGIQ